ncbi:MAG: hypothetical protein ACI8Y7_000616 [Candidatus Woesearchaeota archaeon]|jgi:hypothetical protein
MLNEKRIKEAEFNVTTYITQNLLKKINPNTSIIRILEQNANESLIEAQRVESSLWKIVISYYAMFYIANAVLVKIGYKVGNKIAHKVTSDAVFYLEHTLFSK